MNPLSTPRLAPAGWARRAACSMLAVALAWPSQAGWAQVRLPSLGEAAAEDFGVGAERRLGEQVMREIRRDPDYLDDPALLAYVQGLWQPLLDAARARGDIPPDTETQFAWEAFLVRDRSVNAFALPGGFVGAHLGLIGLTASRDELASVLAHELAHVTQRHIARSMANSSRQGLIGMAALLLGVLAASRSSNPDAAQAAIVGGQALAVQGQLNFSRDMEREADRVGHGMLTAAGFGSAGMVAMFEKLESANRLNDSGGYPYLRSHPLTTDRISDARSRLPFGAAPLPEGSHLHSLMRARARVLMDPNVVALRRQQDQRQQAVGGVLTERLSALYASALAAGQLRDWTAANEAALEALRLAQTLAGHDGPALRALRLLLAQLAIAQGQVAEARSHLAHAQAQPAGREGLLLQAQVALLKGEQGPDAAALAESTQAMQAWVTDHKADALAWQTLAQTTQAQGLRLRSLRAMAEARAALGDLPGAIDGLRSAQRLVREGGAQDFIESSVVDARLRQLLAQRRALLAEARQGREPGAGEP